MKRFRHPIRAIREPFGTAGVIIAMVALVGLGILSSSTAAAAQSTTMYPAGDTVAVSRAASGLIKFKPTSGPGNVLCAQMNGGSFTIPTSNQNPEGPVKATYSIDPTYNQCNGNGGAVTTSGTWTISAQEYGLATPVVTVPAGGIELGGKCGPEVPMNFTGTSAWFNGFESPVTVNSVIFLGAPSVVPWGPECFNTGLPASVEISAPGLLTLTDTTHPLSAPVLGP